MTEPTHNATLYIITGSRGAGKTTFCQTLVRAARAAGWQVAGLISNPVYESTRRTQIMAEDLRSGETRLLATRKDPDQPVQGIATRNWLFDPKTIGWGNTVLNNSLPADLFVMDELGTLEFERQQGWQAGLTAIDSRRFTIALLVMRPELLGDALQRWPDSYIVEIETPEDLEQKAKILAIQLFK